ncbi:recQ-mediated genome instability protein 1-like isoform X2 [Liolophura sinensis]|uniref:recQ-mediated genome instability protein 1-like isoform X2 n=1 Tax=Liolophura sinensis TaxID=3198878 RepID=UPI0031595A2C
MKIDSHVTILVIQGAPLTTDQLTGMVYEQFLSADLRELQMGCLPPQLAHETKFMLQGVFCLQVDSLLDVSQPYYGQLQKVQGTENANVHVTATQPTQPAPEMKAGRMLMLKLTDGVTDVQGIEYQPIPALHKNLLPGCKVRIKGRLLCRKGVLFLKSENVEILGGEVDSLVESNTQDRLLQNALASIGQSSTEDHHMEFNNTQITHPTNSTAGPNTGRQGETTGGLLRGNGSGLQSNSSAGRPPSNRIHNSGSYNTADEMDDDDDDFLASLGTSDLAALDENCDDDMKDVNLGQRLRPENKLSSTSSHVSRLQKDPEQYPTPIGLTKPMACVNGIRQPLTAQLRSEESKETSMTRPSQLGQPGKTGNQNISPSHMTRVTSCQMSNQRSDSKSMDTMESEIQMELENLADLMDDDFPMDDDDDFDDSSVFHPTIPKRSKPSKSNVIKSECKTSTDPPCPAKSLNTLGKQNSLSNSITDNDPHALCKPGDTFRQSIISPSASTVTSGGDGTSSKQCGDRSNTGTGLPSFSFPDFSKLTKPDDIISHIRSVAGNVQMTSMDASDDDPFTYLSKVESMLQSRRPFCIKVKAYVGTLLSRLESGKGKGWTLTCRLNDGTATLDVDITDQALTKMIGFSVQDSLALKREERGKSDLWERINNCQLKVINTSSIFKVEYQPTSARAQVTEITPVTCEHIEKLYARVCLQMSVS